MASENFIVEERHTIATVTINRPEMRNAIGGGMWAELHDIVEQLSASRALRVIVLRGAGQRAFAAGADISRFGAERANPAQSRIYSSAVTSVMTSIERSPKAVIAMIHGYAVGGGCNLAVACDLRIAGDSARIGITAARLGIVIGLRDTRRLTSLVGPAQSRKMLMTAGLLSAPEALRIGLVDEVVPDDDLEGRTYELAAQIAANAPYSVAGAKASIRTCLEDPLLANPGEVGELAYLCFGTDDHKEGVQAFLEKRTPEFKGL